MGLLPNSVKLEKPYHFDGSVDAKKLEAFIFQVEQYARLMGMCDNRALAMFAGMLLIGPAAVWLCGHNWD